jgi:hypothetical protein
MNIPTVPVKDSLLRVHNNAREGKMKLDHIEKCRSWCTLKFKCYLKYFHLCVPFVEAFQLTTSVICM